MRRRRLGAAPQFRQGSEQRTSIGRRAQVKQRDTRNALDAEFDRQQMDPGISLAREFGRERRDARLCQHHHFVEAIHVLVQLLARRIGPGAGGDRSGDAVQHADDAGMDRAVQAVQLGPRPLRQQNTADQRGDAGGEQEHHQAHRQRRRRIVGDQADEVGDQRHDTE